MRDAYLFDVVSGQITGTPASMPLYGSWRLAGGYLIGETADLAGADLAGLDLESNDFGSANLTGANLTNADLHEASFSNADIAGAQFAGATMTEVDAYGVTGIPASLPAHWVLLDATLLGPGVFISNIGLPGENLSGLDLAGAYIYGANLTNVNFDDTDLAGVSFGPGTNLTGSTFAGADLTGATWQGVTCPDGVSSDKYIGGCFGTLDTTPPVVTVTGVQAGHVYALGSVPTAGCQTADPYSRVTSPATVTVTSESSGGLGTFTATCAGAEDQAGNVAASVQVTYKIAYGFSGFSSPPHGATLARSARDINVVFGLMAANGKPISRSTGAALARDHDVRVVLRGPGIAAVTASCSWHSAGGGYFRCEVSIPRHVRIGRSHRYTITAYEQDPFTGFVAAPGEPTKVSPVVVHFR